MTLLKIARMGHPVLRRPAVPVEDPSDPAVRRLIDDMVDTMVDARGVGLAAPQVHESVRVIVAAFPPPAASEPDAAAERGEDGSSAGLAGGRVAKAFVNPVLTPLGDEMETAFEGCLSIPGLRGVVPRWSAVAVEAMDADGRPFRLRADGFEARILQHEVDHLDGVLYPERMESLRSLAFDSEMHHLLDG